MAEPVVNWDAIAKPGSSDHVGGPRHYEGSEVRARHPWKCPACGTENSVRPLEEGCEHCHSGEGAARHIGADPVVTPEMRRQLEQAARHPGTPIKKRIVEHRDEMAPWTSVDQALLAWIRQARDVTIADAFKAGWEAAHAMDREPLDTRSADRDDRPVPARDAPRETPDHEAPGAAGLVGTVQARTIIAALSAFAENILKADPEEVRTGEWLSADQIESLIEDVRTRYV